ncbi:hypothetical protein KZ460_05705 [Glaesserella parasuis]|nr:hypothetical protein HPSMNH_0806 [Glaesserella parasuis MN-H]MCT8716911.1 hypothetical protein [Glaesserella parasuis]MCT8718997.1 hypothetical protein [Glaesserella parasuis]MCT8725117.1 hypothetical protein [Glaesserella parasuis]
MLGISKKNGLYWKEKQDVTLMALYCVAQHCIERNEPVILLEHNKPKYEITVRVIND